jgi:hypothetical protein
MKKKRLIPFNLLPAAWGLTGKSRKIAEAEYYYDGYDLEVELALIEHGDSAEYNKALIAIDLKHNRIDQLEADRKLAKLKHPEGSVELEVALLEVSLKHEMISQIDYDKKRADLLEEPFMAMPKISWDPIDPSKTYFELDYNEHFVRYLEQNGYVGTEEEIINRWLNDVCLSVLDEVAPTDTEFVRTVRTVRRTDGKTEHS